jgi:hypothetical protein
MVQTSDLIKARVDALMSLGKLLQAKNQADNPVYREAYFHNNWFIESNIVKAVDAIVESFLDENKLRAWLDGYDLKPQTDKTLGLVFAGNLPLVGIHDFICAYVLGMPIQYKPSSKDRILPRYFLDLLREVHTGNDWNIQEVERLAHFDAIIATGSNNSNRYFEYYFRGYPHILRRNRHSVAVLDGEESPEELELLADDLFQYFGLGCRNISKLYVPVGYEMEAKLFPALEKYRWLADHAKYKNNYDYSLSLKILNQDPYVPNDLAVFYPDEALAGPIACIPFELYKDLDKVSQNIDNQIDKLQVATTSERNLARLRTSVPVLSFGQTQKPGLSDYPDHEDVMRLLLSL